MCPIMLALSLPAQVEKKDHLFPRSTNTWVVEHQSPRQPRASEDQSGAGGNKSSLLFIRYIYVPDTGLSVSFQDTPKGGAVTIPIFQKRKLRHKERLVPVHTARKCQSRPTAPGSRSQRPRNATTPRKGRVSAFILVRAENKAQGHLSKPKRGKKQRPLREE